MANFTPSPEPWLRHWLKLSLETLPGAEATERKKLPDLKLKVNTTPGMKLPIWTPPRTEALV